MSIVSRLFPPRDENRPASGRTATTNTDWIDLSDYASNEKADGAGAHTLVRFAELRALDDLKRFSTYVYDGSILILDFSKVQSDEILLRRLTNELRKLATDTGGDLAGLGDHHILLTPTGIKVDRKVLTAKTEAESDPEPSIPRTSASPPPAPAPVAPAPPPLPGPPGSVPQRSNGRRPNGGR